MHYTAQLSAQLAKQKELIVTVILPIGTDVSLFSSDIRLQLVDIPVFSSVSNILKLVTGIYFFKLYRAIAATKPDVIHLNSSHPLLLVTLPLLARKYNVVATIHDATSHPGTDKNLRKHLERLVVVRHAKYIFVHRDVIRTQFLELNPNIDKSQVLITPHGDYDFFNKVNNNSTTEEAATLLFFGRISIYKGLIHLVEAVELIRQKHPNLKVIIAGNGDLGQQVQQAMQDKIYEVHNRFISDKEVPAFFSRSRILVLPYIEASESGVIQVGKAFNKPIISTHVGGIPEAITDGKTGIIVPPEDSHALADAIDRLLSDKGKYEEIKKNIQQEGRNRPGWKEASATMTDIYNTVSS